MKIYFAGSIRGGRDDKEFYASIIAALQKYGTVLTEHIGFDTLTDQGEPLSEIDIFERDMAWVRDSDLIVAEVTQPSLGVGYEIGQAEANGTPVLCLYRETEGKLLSAMIVGNKKLTLRSYETLEDFQAILQEFFTTFAVSR